MEVAVSFILFLREWVGANDEQRRGRSRRVPIPAYAEDEETHGPDEPG